MSPLRTVLLGLSSISSIVLASPIKEDLVKRAGPNSLLCALENPVLQAFDAKASASAFCSSYLSIPVLTFSATVTATTSTSTTTTITTGTETDTASTSTLTDISTTTTTTVTSTTTDNTAPTVLKRAGKAISIPVIPVPSSLAKLAAPLLSSACSCLSVPTSSVTKTQSVTTTIVLTSSTSTVATTTTTTPVTETSTTATETATSTAVILKSDVIASMVAIVSADSYQSFCSDILGYTTPLATVYQTTTSTTVTTESTTTTQTTDVATVTVTDVVAKRQDASDPTPTALAGYPADYVTSACSLAVTSPGTSTISSTIVDTATQTTVEVYTQIVDATATATATVQPSSDGCSPSNSAVMLNGGFECGTLTPWVIGTNRGGTIGIVSDGDDSANALSVFSNYYANSAATSINIYQVLNTVPGETYQLSFDRSGAGGGGNSWSVAVGSNPAFASGTSGGSGQTDWTSYTTTFTAVGSDKVNLVFSSTSWAYAYFYFDNFVITRV